VDHLSYIIKLRFCWKH